MEYTVLEAFLVNDHLLVLFDPDSYFADTRWKSESKRSGASMRNLQCFDLVGRRLWEAEFPEPLDYYYRIASTNPLAAYSFSSFLCRIDPDTGRIVSKTFIK
jgi:hypothetical protein